MKKLFIAIAMLTCVASLAYAKTTEREALAQAEKMSDELDTLLDRTLKAKLYIYSFAEIVGTYEAITKGKALAISRKYGAKIRRVGIRFRNRANSPDDYERRKLLQMVRDNRDGRLEKAYFNFVTTPDGKKFLRYMKPIVTLSSCLKCHGAKDTLTPSATRRIKELYPNDNAMGFLIGEVQGAYSVIYPME